MKKLIFFFLLPLSLQAVLPPLWQGTKEIKAILSDEQFGTIFDSGEILEEIRKESNGYVVIGSKHSAKVEVVYLPNEAGRVGPATFKLIFHKDK